MGLFGSTSPISAAVTQATAENAVGANWELNFHIAQLIREDFDNGPRHAIKALKSRFKNKNTKVVVLSLILLETLVKNCQDGFVRSISEPDFQQVMSDLVKKSQGEPRLRDKVLQMVQFLAVQYRDRQHDFPGFQTTYETLKAQGVRFLDEANIPESLSTTGPTVQHGAHATTSYSGGGAAPTTSSSSQSQSSVRGHLPPSSASTSVSSSQPAPASLQSSSSPSQSDVARISEQLDMVQNSGNLLGSMVGALEGVDPRSSEVIVDLAAQCREMSKKLQALVGQTQDETLLLRALALNDELNTQLENHDAVVAAYAAEEQYGGAQRQPAPMVQEEAPVPSHATATPSTDPGISLLDVGAVVEATATPAAAPVDLLDLGGGAPVTSAAPTAGSLDPFADLAPVAPTSVADPTPTFGGGQLPPLERAPQPPSYVSPSLVAAPGAGSGATSLLGGQQQTASAAAQPAFDPFANVTPQPASASPFAPASPETTAPTAGNDDFDAFFSQRS